MPDNGVSRKGKAPIASTQRASYGGTVNHQHHQQSGPATMNESQYRDPVRVGAGPSLSDAPYPSAYQSSRKRRAQDTEVHNQTQEQYREKRQRTTRTFGLNYDNSANTAPGMQAGPSTYPAHGSHGGMDPSSYGHKDHNFHDPFGLFPVGQFEADVYHGGYMDDPPNSYTAAEQWQDFGPDQTASEAYMSHPAAGEYAAANLQQYRDPLPGEIFLIPSSLDWEVIPPIVGFPTRWPNPRVGYNEDVAEPLQHMAWPEGDSTPCNEQMMRLRLQHADLDGIPYTVADYPVVETMVIAEQAWGLDNALGVFLPRHFATSRAKNMLKKRSKPGGDVKSVVQWCKKQPQCRISFWDSDHMVEMLRPFAATKRSLSLFDIVMLRKHVEDRIAVGARNEEELALPLPPSLAASAPPRKTRAKNAQEQIKEKQISKRDSKQPDERPYQAHRQADWSTPGVNRHLTQEKVDMYGSEVAEWPQNELLFQQPVVPFSSSPVSSYLRIAAEALPNEQVDEEFMSEPAPTRPRHGKMSQSTYSLVGPIRTRSDVNRVSP